MVLNHGGRCRFLFLVFLLTSLLVPWRPPAARAEAWTTYLPGALGSNGPVYLAVGPDNTLWRGDYWEGTLSRFDGSAWTTYTKWNSALPGDRIFALAIDKAGDVWVATADTNHSGLGVSKLDGSAWTTYTTANSGLASNDVRQIAVDDRGAVWFGTSGGVSRFDGSTWTTYTAANSGLGFDGVEKLAVDARGTVWVTAPGAGASAFDGTAWKHYTTANSGLMSNDVNSMALAPDGTAWFGSYFAGAGSFDGTTWRHYTAANSGLPSDYIVTLAVDARGTVWFSTYGIVWSDGVTAFDGTAWTTYTTDSCGLVNGAVDSIVADPAGPVWFSATSSWEWPEIGGVSRFDGSAWTTYRPSNSGLSANGIISLAIDGHGVAWVNTVYALDRFDGAAWTTYGDTGTTIPARQTHQIAVDGQGVAWFAQDGALSRFDGVSWTIFGWWNNDLWGAEAVAIDRAGDVWTGNSYDLRRFDGSAWTIYDSTNSGRGFDGAYELAFDAHGTLWIGGNAGGYGYGGIGGIDAFDGATWTTYTMANTSGGLVWDTINGIAIDDHDVKWIATWHGASRFDGTTWTTYTVASTGGALVTNLLWSVGVDRQGAVWFGTDDSGVVRFDGTTWTTFNTTNSGLTSNRVVNVALDGDGTLWFSTYGGGVSTFDGTTWRSYTTANSGLVYPHVTGVAFDGAGGVWFGTLSAVSHLRPGWRVRATATKGGSIGPVGDVVVPPGAEQTFTVTPAAGFTTTSLLVDGAEVGPLASYTFRDLTRAHTISAVFAPVPIDPTPVAPTLVSPSGPIASAKPTYVWNAQPGALTYRLWVGTGSTTTLSRGCTAAEAGCAAGTGTCSLTPDATLGVGSWYFNVKAVNGAGAGPWGVAKYFTVVTRPTAVTLLSPTGLIVTSLPAYRWNAQPGVESYQLWVGTGTTTLQSFWYTAKAAGCQSGSDTCSVTPATALAEGSWYFNVRGRNVAGTGPWSVARKFTYTLVEPPSALTLLSPSGATGTSAPTYTWSAQRGVDTYRLWIGNGYSTALSVLYTAAAAGCGSGEATCSATPATPLARGTWYFSVTGTNLAGAGPWARALFFATP